MKLSPTLYCLILNIFYTNFDFFLNINCNLNLLNGEQIIVIINKNKFKNKFLTFSDWELRGHVRTLSKLCWCK